MKAMSRFLVASMLIATLGGCVVAIGPDEFERSRSDWSELERDNRRAIDNLTLGTRLAEVRDAMPHTADFSEAFVSNGIDYRVLFYRTQRVEGDGATTRDETTPLVFADGELVGWGPSALRDATGSRGVPD
jgi:hypothetical protein